jgi:hypothetical protein
LADARPATTSRAGYDAAIADAYGYLEQESDSEAARAAQLRRELGRTFLDGTPKQRAQIVRDLIRNYREQGRLPRHAPPQPRPRARPVPDVKRTPAGRQVVSR